MADYKQWILMGSLMGMAIAAAPAKAMDHDHEREHRGESQRQDDLDDRGLFQENQRETGQEGKAKSCQECQQGKKFGPAQLTDDGI